MNEGLLQHFRASGKVDLRRQLREGLVLSAGKDLTSLGCAFGGDYFVAQS